MHHCWLALSGDVEKWGPSHFFTSPRGLLFASNIQDKCSLLSGFFFSGSSDVYLSSFSFVSFHLNHCHLFTFILSFFERLFILQSFQPFIFAFVGTYIFVFSLPLLSSQRFPSHLVFYWPLGILCFCLKSRCFRNILNSWEKGWCYTFPCL